MSLRKVVIFVYFDILCGALCFDNVSLDRLRHKRSLIFPPTTPTRVQFICGIGIPVEDLNYESITSGYVLKAEYFLPTNATQLHKNYLKPQTIHRRRSIGGTFADKIYQHESDPAATFKMKTQQNDLSTYRWTIYKAIEKLADRMGLDGKACMLKCICEIASIPFHHTGGVLAELAHIVMTPSSSVDFIHHHFNNKYLHAEMLGRSGFACSLKFPECRHSLLENFSTVLNYIMGLDGKACMLKCICEIASIPFHHTGGVLAELAHIVMTPSSSVDFIHHHFNNKYLHAEMLGRSGFACSLKFPECRHSLLENFSTVLNYM